jgi:N-acyl-D-aspartate/D-glutamate deacylase
MAEHLAGREAIIAANYITLVGHNRLRSHAGFSGSTPSPAQLENMRNTLAEAMEEGAFGLSTGLIYATGYNSSTEEIIALAEVVQGQGGVYASHIRGEGTTVLTAVAEAIEICRATGVPTQISHVKCAGPAVWNLSDEYLALVDAALTDGLPIMMDMYPYTASQTTISVLFPAWALNNWTDAVTNHRAELEEDTRSRIAGRGGADRVYFISGPFSGQWLSDAAANAGKDPEDLLIDDVGPGGAAAIYHQMLEEDVQHFMQHPLVMMGSDGPTGSHPRGQGTFARFWGHYGRELGLFGWQDLVMKTSTLPMRQFLLDRQRRGALRTGWFADIVVLDPNTIIDRATFDSPGTLPQGMSWTLVNGQIAARNGSTRVSDAGRVLWLQDSLIPSGQMFR